MGTAPIWALIDTLTHTLDTMTDVALNPERVHVVRYSYDIEADIKRDWTSNMWYCETREEIAREVWGYYPTEELVKEQKEKIRQTPDGMWGVWHHDGLACCRFEGEQPETLEEAKKLYERNETEDSTFGSRTIGQVEVAGVLKKEDDGLTHYLLACDDIQRVHKYL